jgi:hypothetical protein
MDASRRERSVADAHAAVAAAAAAGDVAALARVLAAHATHMRVAEAALTALEELAHRQLAQTPLCAFPSLSLPARRMLSDGCLAVLRAHAGHAEKAFVLELALIVLSLAVQTSDGSVLAEMRAHIWGCAPALATAMRQNPRREALLQAAGDVLHAAPHEDDAWRESAIAAGVLEAIVAALQHHARSGGGGDTANEKTTPQSTLLRALYELVPFAAAESAAAVRAETAGATAAVTAAMRAAPRDELLQTRACIALAHIY